MRCNFLHNRDMQIRVKCNFLLITLAEMETIESISSKPRDGKMGTSTCWQDLSLT